jgi:short-subunit dehydrogenase
MTSTGANVVQELKQYPDQLGILGTVLDARIVHVNMLTVLSIARQYGDEELHDVVGRLRQHADPHDDERRADELGETVLDVDRRLMEINFIGTVSLSKAVLPVMTRQRAGHIAVVSSLVGHIGTPYRSAYSASKHALHGFFDSLRAEIWRDGIAVTIVCPGFVRTDVSVNALAGDGSVYGVMNRGQARGMDADRCARIVVRRLKRRPAEIWVGGWEVIATWIERLCPPLFRHLVKRVDPT